MKTTLKRGVGRSAQLDGNGRSTQAPAALTPITRYEQPGKGRGIVGIIGRVLFFLMAACVSLLLGIGGGYWLEGEQTVLDISNASLADPQIRKAVQKLEIPLPNRPAIAMAAATSPASCGKATNSGSRAYMLASLE